MIREIEPKDLHALLSLYTQLHDNAMPPESERLAELWQEIMDDGKHHIIVAELDGQIVSSCVLVIIPNLTHGQRPYALVENVVTDRAYRKQGFASACLDRAKQLALQSGCYKIMLLTGAKTESTLNFYEQCGYNRQDKTGFVQWLDG